MKGFTICVLSVADVFIDLVFVHIRRSAFMATIKHSKKSIFNANFRMLFLLIEAYISSPSYSKSYFDCASLPGLTRKQLEICKRSKFTMRIIANELKNITEVCKEQFANERWNCPLNHELGIMPSKGWTTFDYFIKIAYF